MKSSHTTRHTQKGFVSIIVAAMIMILLSLITVGFTRIMQREQREALDRQLNRQATYAAEGAIYQVWDALQADIQTTNTLPQEKQTCADAQGNVFGFESGDLELAPPESAYINGDDQDASLQVSCVLYDKTPSALEFLLKDGESRVVNLESASGTPINTLSFSWSGDDNGLVRSCDTFPISHNGVPMLRMDIVNRDNLSRDELNNKSYFFYVIPCRGASSGSINISQQNNGSGGRSINKIPASCSESRCDINVSGLGGASYVARIKLLYGGGNLSITGTDTNSQDVEFARSQVAIDITARATDVVRRLRVNLSQGGVDPVSGSAAFSAKGICKDIGVIDDGSQINGYKLIDNCPEPEN